MITTNISERFELRFDPASHRRRIAGTDVILHCHHYNSRIQRTIESAQAVDGRGLFVATAEEVFAAQLATAFLAEDDERTRLDVAAALYSHLGYGTLDFSSLSAGVVLAPTSHFAEGWRAGFPNAGRPVCSLTAGYLQAALHAITGDRVRVEEEQCTLQDDTAPCRFRVHRDRAEPPSSGTTGRRSPSALDSASSVTQLPPIERSHNVDAAAILDALVALPLVGDASGLVPAFNVYLASTPADFYNLVCIRFVEAMTSHGLGTLAREQLISDAESCGMNTFRGIMASTEWDALVAPMIRDERDPLFAIIAVSNALGWGNWHVSEYHAPDRARFVSLNGYEAQGLLDWAERVTEPGCLMLTGVAAGILELLHGVGTIEERFGQYFSQETACRGVGDDHCKFEVEVAQ